MNINAELRNKFTDIFDFIGEQGVEIETLTDELNMFLDSLLDEDYFGTEGQCDPRKDWRDQR